MVQKRWSAVAEIVIPNWGKSRSRKVRMNSRRHCILSTAVRARYERGLLHDGFRRQVAQRIKDGELSEAEGSELINFYESRFDAYTYVSVNGNHMRGRRRHDY